MLDNYCIKQDVLLIGAILFYLVIIVVVFLFYNLYLGESEATSNSELKGYSWQCPGIHAMIGTKPGATTCTAYAISLTLLGCFYFLGDETREFRT